MLYSFSNFHTREEIIHWIISLILNIFLNCGFIESHRTHIIKRIVSCIEILDTMRFILGIFISFSLEIEFCPSLFSNVDAHGVALRLLPSFYVAND